MPRQSDNQDSLEGPFIREHYILFALFFLLLMVMFFSLFFGRYTLSMSTFKELVSFYLAGEELPQSLRQAETMLFVVRIPRVLLCAMVGAGLAVSGAAYQALFRNPLVSPDILGVSSGASVGAAFGLLMGFSSVFVHIASFTSGLIAVSIVLALTRVLSQGGTNLVVLVLSGVVASSFFMAIVSFIKIVADSENILPEIVFWLMGSFARSGNYANIRFLGGILLMGVIPLYLLRWQMNALAFGEEEAVALGVPVRQIRRCIIVCATLLTAGSVALCGLVGWVGLLVPHMARSMVGPSYRFLLPASILLGSSFMLIVDTFCRSLLPGEIPISIITAFLGAPLFLYMLYRGQGGWR